MSRCISNGFCVHFPAVTILNMLKLEGSTKLPVFFGRTMPLFQAQLRNSDSSMIPLGITKRRKGCTSWWDCASGPWSCNSTGCCLASRSDRAQKSQEPHFNRAHFWSAYCCFALNKKTTLIWCFSFNRQLQPFLKCPKLAKHDVWMFFWRNYVQQKSCLHQVTPWRSPGKCHLSNSSFPIFAPPEVGMLLSRFPFGRFMSNI